MTSAVSDRAKTIGQWIAAADPEHAEAVSYDVRDVYTPGWLVVPLPTYDFNVLQGGGATLVWTVYALHHGQGDLEAADVLGNMIAQLMAGDGELSIETAEPARYAVPTSSDPLPAYKLTMTETVEVSP